MARRSLRLLLVSGAAVAAAAVATGVGASAGATEHKVTQTASHSVTPTAAHNVTQSVSYWFAQTEPAKDRAVALRNGSTPAAAGHYRIAVQVTSPHHNALSCFAERRDGGDLGQEHTIAARNTAPVTIATAVPAGTQYNLICLGTAQGRQVLKGTITETAQ